MTSIDASMRPALHAEIPTLSHPEAFALRAEETVSDDLAEVDCLQSRPFSRFQERQRHHRHGPHRCSVLQRLLPLPARTHQGARHPPLRRSASLRPDAHRLERRAHQRGRREPAFQRRPVRPGDGGGLLRPLLLRPRRQGRPDRPARRGDPRGGPLLKPLVRTNLQGAPPRRAPSCGRPRPSAPRQAPGLSQGHD